MNYNNLTKNKSKKIHPDQKMSMPLEGKEKNIIIQVNIIE
jgi:hypothetical protein